jgi:hypothetical protein
MALACLNMPPRKPCLRAFLETLAFPSGDRGPVLKRHGAVSRQLAAWFNLFSSVHIMIRFSLLEKLLFQVQARTIALSLDFIPVLGVSWILWMVFP